ncbi:Lysine methyltransferase [Popillia japonica]|uniref:protein-histidine N-methyltransferase n=1 Tax=Popillia japonica TaxID=7064 RepID=A0AAW1MPF0_POPJA
MFKFNFIDKNTNEISSDSLETNQTVALCSTQIFANETIPCLNISASDLNYFNCTNNLIVKYLSTNYIIKCMKDQSNAIIYADRNHSDLVAGVYEGGLKIWECTQDLINFISFNNTQLANQSVLDLGCGVGIIGTFCLLKGAFVYFQDYNPEVIRSVTIPNVMLNLENLKNVQEFSKFYSGDWTSFLDILKENKIKFDIILTSETIYNTESYSKLHSIFTNCLKKDGVVYVAAKTYYFGVGGGLRSFEEFVSSKGILNFTPVWTHSNGISREIIKLSWKHEMQ